MAEFFEKNGIKVWLDIQEASSSSNSSTDGGLFGEITKGINEVAVVVACISDEYTMSKNCLLEFRFAHCSLKKPIIKSIVGLGNEWKKHEISFLGGDYPEINFQFNNEGGIKKC